MLPDDPRHGTTAGHYAHRVAGEPACHSCIAAKTKYEKVRQVYGDRMVPAVGTRRRTQALMALGHSQADIAKQLGTSHQAVHKIRTGTSDKIFAATADGIARVYEQMSMTLSTSSHAARVRNRAAREGWLPPLAWNNIDDPTERPTAAKPAERYEDTVDHAIVWRVINEQRRPRQLTRAEAEEVLRILLSRGISTHVIERDYGIKPDRYKGAAA